MDVLNVELNFSLFAKKSINHHIKKEHSKITNFGSVANVIKCGK